jgi:hypothetical protein
VEVDEKSTERGDAQCSASKKCQNFLTCVTKTIERQMPKVKSNGRQQLPTKALRDVEDVEENL